MKGLTMISWVEIGQENLGEEDLGGGSVDPGGVGKFRGQGDAQRIRLCGGY